MRGRVLIPTTGSGLRWVRLKPVWGRYGEEPLYTATYPEGWMVWYGSRRVEVRLRAVPIIVRMPIAVVGSRLRYAVPVDRVKGMSMALRKIVAGEGSASQGGPGASDMEQWPNLWQYLTATTYPEGGARQTSTIIIVADTAGWRGCVSDKDNDRTLWRSHDSVEGLLLALEEALAADDPSAWRQTGGGFKNRRKRS